MKKIFVLILNLLVILCCFSGCTQAEEMFQIQADGTGMISAAVRFEKEAAEQFAAGMGMTVADILGVRSPKTTEEGGLEYYVLEDSQPFDTYSELKEFLEQEGYEDVYVSDAGIRYLFSSDSAEMELKKLEEAGLDTENSFSFTLRFDMEEEIQLTTGELSEDKKSAVYQFDGNSFFEPHDIVVSVKTETEGPVIRGAVHKKTYNSARTISASDCSGVEKLQYKYKKPGSSEYGKYYRIKDSRTFTKNGTYYIRSYDGYGNKSVKRFTINDKKKPVISLEGKMNKSETYYKECCQVTVSDNCAVKSIKYYINDKKIKTSLAEILENGITAETEGTHRIVAADVNGNERTVSFKVK